MQFKVQASVLMTALKKIVRVGTHNGSITDLMLCSLTDNELTVTATNTKEKITTTFKVEGQYPGSALLPTQKVVALVQSLPDDTEIEFDSLTKSRVKQPNGMTMKAVRGRYQLNGLPPDDFPDLSTDPTTEITLTLDAQELHRAMSTCQYAMGKNDVRHYLNGMLLEVNGPMLRMVATDGHRLSWSDVAWPDMPVASATPLDSDEPQRFILPAEAVRTVTSLLAKHHSTVKLALNKHHAVFSIEGTAFLTVLISGTYPDYRRVIPDPEKATGRITVDSTKMTDAVNRVAALIDRSKPNQGVSIRFEKDGLVLEAQNASDESARDFVEAEVEAPDFDAIGLNVYYLADLAAAEDSLTIQLYNADSSIYATTKQGDRGHVLMPVRL